MQRSHSTQSDGVREVRSRLVSFFGPDGSGKTTQAKMLAEHLGARGVKVRLAWIRSKHTLAYLVLSAMRRCSPGSVVMSPGGGVMRIKGVGGRSWALLEFLSLAPLVLLRVYLPLISGRVVIAERFLVDSIVAIAYTLGDASFDTSREARLMLAMIPRNSVLIHLDSDYEEITRRRGGYSDPPDFVRFQRVMYDKLSKRLRAAKIDTGRAPVEETFSLVLSAAGVARASS